MNTGRLAGTDMLGHHREAFVRAFTCRRLDAISAAIRSTQAGSAVRISHSQNRTTLKALAVKASVTALSLALFRPIFPAQ